jgi:DNA-directed RNA polymerase I and III subunit RPAC2
MNLRIQTYGRSYMQNCLDLTTNNLSDGVSVYTVLEKGLEDLMAMCDVVEQKFTIARDDFVNKMEE